MRFFSAADCSLKFIHSVQWTGNLLIILLEFTTPLQSDTLRSRNFIAARDGKICINKWNNKNISQNAYTHAEQFIYFQYLIKLLTGNDLRSPMHFSRSVNRAFTLFFNSVSKFERVFSNCWCCASAVSNLWCNNVMESCRSYTSDTSRDWAVSL